jgi:hypothetical protein
MGAYPRDLVVSLPYFFVRRLFLRVCVTQANSTESQIADFVAICNINQPGGKLTKHRFRAELTTALGKLVLKSVQNSWSQSTRNDATLADLRYMLAGDSFRGVSRMNRIIFLYCSFVVQLQHFSLAW